MQKLKKEKELLDSYYNHPGKTLLLISGWQLWRYWAIIRFWMYFKDRAHVTLLLFECTVKEN